MVEGVGAGTQAEPQVESAGIQAENGNGGSSVDTAELMTGMGGGPEFQTPDRMIAAEIKFMTISKTMFTPTLHIMR